MNWDVTSMSTDKELCFPASYMCFCDAMTGVVEIIKLTAYGIVKRK